VGTLPLLDDTVAAIATAPGRGALALIRISGPRAFDVLVAISGEEYRTPPGDAERVARLIAIRHPLTAEVLDRAMVTTFLGPRSFTGEDTVEICTHGGVLTPQLVLGAAVAAGARIALPGEFTRRAYLNGKLDLVQAEAIADLIDGRSPLIHRAALHQMERGLSRRLDELRESILRAEALAAYSIDFPEEDEPPVPPATVREAALRARERIVDLLRTAPEGEMLRTGALVVLAGLPNSGKSSLFNSLLGLERSIVTDLPGTTRDAVEAELILEGYPFRLVDTAGIRSTEDRVEGLGIEVALRYLAAADIIILCSDGDGELLESERGFLEGLRDGTAIIVRTKADQRGATAPGSSRLDGAEKNQGERRVTDAAAMPEQRVSARTGEGLPELRELLLATAYRELRSTDEVPLVTRERHSRALRIAVDELDRFSSAVMSGVPMELATTHLRSAAAAIEEIIGVVTPDDVLGALFATFCVGK
jgi:tRNA modification GTPase